MRSGRCGQVDLASGHRSARVEQRVSLLDQQIPTVWPRGCDTARRAKASGWQRVSPTLMTQLQAHAQERGAAAVGGPRRAITPASRSPHNPARRVPKPQRWFACAGAQKGAATGPSPVDRARIGSKHHVIIDRGGIPLAVTLTGGNRHDSTQLIPLVDALPMIRGKRGRPWQRPRWLYGDRGYDYEHHRKSLRDSGNVSAYRPQERRSRLRPRRDPLGRGTHFCLAAPVQTPPHALRTTRRHPSRTAPTRMRPDLLPPTHDIILERAVSDWRDARHLSRCPRRAWTAGL